MYGQSFTLKSREKFLAFMSAVDASPLPEADLNHRHDRICTVREQPTVDDL